MKISPEIAAEVRHKLGVLKCTPDLLAEYDVTEAAVEALIASVPRCGGDWEIPPSLDALVREEMIDHVAVLERVADSARAAGQVGQSLAISKTARRIERLFTA